MSGIDAPLAFGAGLATVASPCVLPMLPFVLGTAAGESGRARPLLIVLGFTGSFAGLAWLFGSLPDALGLHAGAVRNGALLLLACAGMLMIWPWPMQMLAARLHGVINRVDTAASRTGTGYAGALLLGASMGAVWTPCAGPSLAAILALVAAAQEPGRGLHLLLCYAAGAGLPMLAIGYGGQALVARMRGLLPHTRMLREAAGLLIVLAAAAMYRQYDTLVALWLTT
ncbi:MAG: cytochrome c biogenesis CcdA family protein [Gammaproteobacteria bacterium]